MRILEAQKISLSFDRSAGDRITIGNRWLSDKGKLTRQDRAALQRLLRTWERRGGENFPIFEPKKHVRYGGESLMLYGVELRKRVPPIHAVVFVTDTDPNYDPENPQPQGKLFIFDRVFDSYGEYDNYINHTLTKTSPGKSGKVKKK
jgi:hypothetical protein